MWDKRSALIGQVRAGGQVRPPADHVVRSGRRPRVALSVCHSRRVTAEYREVQVAGPAVLEYLRMLATTRAEQNTLVPAAGRDPDSKANSPSSLSWAAPASGTPGRNTGPRKQLARPCSTSSGTASRTSRCTTPTPRLPRLLDAVDSSGAGDRDHRLLSKSGRDHRAVRGAIARGSD
jgi:hypothetical protein